MRRLLFYPFALFLSAFVTVGCSNINETPVQMQTYDLIKVTDELTLRLTDMVDNIRIVPLETGEGFLIPDSQYRINDKYIVTINKDAIHQFDAFTGKHIRLLAVSGNGPREFNYLGSSFIAYNIFYYAVQGKGNLYGINLETGEHINPYITEYQYLDFQNGSENDSLYIPNDSTLFEIYNFKTKKSAPLIDSLFNYVKKVKNDNNVKIFLSSLKASSLIQNGDEMFFYNKSYCDTLYTNSHEHTTHYATFIMPTDKMATPTNQGLPNGEQFILDFSYADSQRIICTISNVVIKSTENRLTASMSITGLYNIDRKTGKANIVKKYIFDPLFEQEFVEGINDGENDINIGSIVIGYGSNFFTNKEIYAKAISADKVIEYINDSLNSPNFPDNKKEQLRKLLSKLNEEGNPVVFIGKKK